jgi:DNA-binding NarL/FixJ family response regulator
MKVRPPHERVAGKCIGDPVHLEIATTITPYRDEIARVVVCSDQPILAHGLGSLIAADPAFQLNACCSNIAALKDHLASGTSDLAVLDLMPEITIAVLSELQRAAPDCKVILWTNSIAADFALQALGFGVRGVLGKSLSLEAHRQCLHRVHRGELWFEKSLMESLRASQRVLLTARESQLLTLLSLGFKNKEISCELGLTEGTVKVYLSHLIHKSGAKDRFDLAIQSLKNLNMAGISPGDRGGGLRFLVIDPLCRERHE